MVYNVNQHERCCQFERRGYLDRSNDSGYRLSAKMFDLQRQDSLEQTLSRAAQPVIERLVEAYKETVNLGMLNGPNGRCIGAPIQAAYGRVVTAVSVSGPVFRMSMNRAKSLAPPLKAACAEIGDAFRRG